MKKVNKWEEVVENTWRMWVPGGWLVYCSLTNMAGLTCTMCFFPDADHTWDIEPPK